MAWVLVVVAGVLEVGFAVALKQSDGFTRLWPSVLFVAFLAGSLGLLNLAVRDLPIGSAYAVWTGIGAAGTATLGILVLGEPSGAARLLFVGIIVVAVVGLQITSTG